MRKRTAEQELQHVVTEMKKYMSAINQTVANLVGSIGMASEFVSLQGISLHNPIITTPLVVSIPPAGPSL